jgi:acetyltransferase
MSTMLENIFNPRSIAIIGASEVPGKAAERRTRSLLEGGYGGEVHLINPKRPEIFGRKAFPNIKEVGKEVDLVMVVVSPRFVVQAVSDSVAMGAKGIIIITAGLGETGEEGKKIEAQILKEAAKTGTRIIGPNCSGMFSGAARINMLGVPALRQGSISVLAQSGNVIDSLTHYAEMRGVGFSKIASLGNAIGVQFHEYIDYLKDDPNTKAVIAYLESIKAGNDLVRVARETAKHKPVIILKVGRSSAGARAAASHTGALAGDEQILDSAFRQAGILRAANVDELFDMAEVFCNCPIPKGNRVAILSEGGGDNSIAADNAELYDMEVPVLSNETQERIKPFLLQGMPASNPVDYGGTAEENPHMITECVRVCMETDEVDGIYITGFFGGFKDIIAAHVAELEEKAARDMAALVEKHQKPLFMHTSFARGDIESLNILKTAGVPVMESSDRSSRCLGAMMQFALTQRKMRGMTPPQQKTETRPEVTAILAAATGDSRTNLLETESRDLLKAYGLTLPEAELVRERNQALEAARKYPLPLAMKVVSPDIIHKSDVGGVKLNLADERAVGEAFDEIIRTATIVTTSDRVLGALVSPMVGKGQECIVGMIRDRQFGPVIMFGLGGIFVEVLKDVAFRVAPLTDTDVDDLVAEIKGHKVLTGVRGEKPKDIDAIKNIIRALSAIAVDNPQINEIDLNPVIVHEQGKGASIVDSRVILTNPGADTEGV